MDESLASLVADVGLPPPEATAALLVDELGRMAIAVEAKLSRKAMLWTVRHRWANGAQFSFNCYRHSAQLILRFHGRPCTVLLSRHLWCTLSSWYLN